MSPGDLVLVPEEKTVYFAHIQGPYQYEKGKVRIIADDNTFVFPPEHHRSLEWLNSVPRNQLSKALQTAHRIHRDIPNLSRFYDEIEAKSKGVAYKEPKKAAIDVSFPLRPDFEVKYTVPGDMTATEAEKLSEHFKTIYFQETGRTPSKERTLVALDKYIADQSMERNKTLLYRLVRNGKLTVADAAEAIDVSPETFKGIMALYDSTHAVIGQSESAA